MSKNEKIALVTGASSGIGRDMAKELALRGYSLILVARDKEKLEKLQKDLHVETTIFCMDLSNSENCKNLHEQIKEKFGNIDILINNAGFGEFGFLTETNLEKEISLIDTNIKAVHILTKLFLIDMVKENKGHILNVSSISGFLPGPLMAAYYSSKAYVLRLSQSVREELRKQKSNVKISVLCPGPVKTNFNNVAGVKFGLHSLTSEYVAKYTIGKMLNNKFLIIPGITIKLIALLSKAIPSCILSKFVYISQKRKRDGK
jgi:short-subunit dehydrogenase